MDGKSCYALAAHRIILPHPDVRQYLCYAELDPDSHPYSSVFKKFILSKDCSGIDDVVNVLLRSNGPQADASYDGGNIVCSFDRCTDKLEKCFSLRSFVTNFIE